MNDAVALAAIALASTTIVGLFKLLNKLSRSMDANTRSNRDIAKATNKGSREAKERNGHLAELIVQSTENTKILADAAVSQITEVVQHVDEQKVERQIVKTVEQK